MKIIFNAKYLDVFIKNSKSLKYDKATKKYDNIIIKVANNTTLFIKSNLEEEIVQAFGCEIIEEGVVCIPSNVFNLLDTKSKFDEFITIEDNLITTDSKTIEIKEDIEPLPFLYDKFTPDYNIFTDLSDKKIKELLEVTHALGSNSVRSILECINIKDNKFAALDGFRLSVREGDFKSEKEVLFKHYNTLASMKGNITATANDKIIRFSNNQFNYYTYLTDGEGIEYEKLFTKDKRIDITIQNIEKLKDGLNKVKSLVKEKNNHVIQLNISKDYIYLNAKNDKVTFEEKFLCTHYVECEESLKICFNVNYLIDSLKYMDKESHLCFTSEVNPIDIINGNKYELLLPVRVKEYA